MPLKIGVVAKWLRQGSAKAPSPVRIRPTPKCKDQSPGDGIGRHTGLKILGTLSVPVRVRPRVYMQKKLFEKVWDAHRIPVRLSDDPNDHRELLYIDLHLVHEVTSPQAFEGLRIKRRKVRRPDLTIATMDHNVPTQNRDLPIQDKISAQQIKVLQENCQEFGITLFDLHSSKNGIVHVIGPELGLTQPGKTIVCGDSHTSTHGAFGALAFGIGTSEVEHVLASQCLIQSKPMAMKANFTGKLSKGVYAKDMILALIRTIGVAGATGHILEYTGDVIRSLSMEARMTICNMSIEAGARAGMIAPDEKTYSYLADREFLPKGERRAECMKYWKTLYSDEEAEYHKEVTIDCSKLSPQITWGTSPGMVTDVGGTIPSPADAKSTALKISYQKALEYMGLKPGMPVNSISLDKVFIGSCTNSRIEDLREAAKVIKNRKKSKSIKQVLVVPGSVRVKKEAESEGLDKIFIEAGFEWRDAGCSMCLAMNDDVLNSGERCASTSNRNFEGRQGKGGRTFLVSPAMASLAALHGHFVDSRKEI